MLKKPRRQAAKTVTDSKADEKQRPSVRIPRSRPLTVIVNRTDQEFPELLKSVRDKVDPGITGTSISRMRQTKTDGLLIEINGSVDSAKCIKAEVEHSLGPTAKVRLADDTAPVEVRDMDELTTKEEILEALSDHDQQNGAKVVSIRKTYGGAQTAIGMLPTETAKRLCSAGRLRVSCTPESDPPN